MGKILTVAVAGIGLALAVAACSSDTCRDSTNAIPVAAFYSSSTQGAITVDSLTVYGVGVPGDSAVIRNEAAAQVYLPLRGSAEECRYVLHYEQRAISDPRLNDTLIVRYVPQLVFTSAECGAMYFYEITGCEATSHLIDSVNVVNADVSNLSSETLRIYFRTSDDGRDDENSAGA